MRRRWLLLGALVLGGCAGDGSSPSSERSDQPRLIETRLARCAVGERPAYFVPSGIPATLLGCARLGVSGKRVEFSGTLDRIGRGIYLCINPAYSGRGSFIPALCKLDPPPSRFAIRDARLPRQGVRDYEFVIWGTAPAATSGVVARFNSGRARAAVFEVPSKRAPWSFGEPVPFKLFVVELPVSAACAPVTVTAEGTHAGERIPPRTKICERTVDGLGGAAQHRPWSSALWEDAIGVPISGQIATRSPRAVAAPEI